MTRRLGMTFTYVGVLLLLAPGMAAAQKKISGTSHCGKAEQQQSIPVGDTPDHAFSISKVKCSWPKPLEIAGLKTTEDEITGFTEVSGNSANQRMFLVGTMSNGDKMYVRPTGRVTFKDGAPQTSTGTFKYTGGTGKLQGIKGKGTYRCEFGADGTPTCNVEGHYEIPEGKK
jgi:hypothetical protein